MQATTLVDRLAAALDATGTLIANVADDQWSRPTPCPDWDVRGLVDHLVFGQRLFAGIVRGEPVPPAEELTRLRALDHLGDDPSAAHRAAGADLLAVFSDPSVLERMFQAPIGTVPGIVLLHLRITEELVHGWDVARATGQVARLPEDAAEAELAFARAQLDVNVPRRGRFGDAQPVADEAPAIDRLAAFLGRPLALAALLDPGAAPTSHDHDR